MKRIKGFTLLELMIVVGIIGVLAMLTLYGLHESRLRADDANVEYYVVQMPSLMDKSIADRGYVYADEPIGECDEGIFTEGDIASIIEQAEVTSAAAAECGAISDAYAVSVDLRGQEDMEYCVDSAGFKGRQPIGTHSAYDFVCSSE